MERNEALPKQRHARHVHLLGQAEGSLRTATFEGREHIVVPIVALVEGVIHAANSQSPELVLAEELEKAPGGWNGRPVVADHPMVNGTPVSASADPRVLELSEFGRLFNARVKEDKLLVDAWLDPDRAKAVGTRAESVLERLQAGEVVEVSVGVFVISEQRSGVWKTGEKYSAVWKELVPDHLALLSEGTIGACSVSAGCGAPRAAMRAALGEGGVMDKETQDDDLRQQLLIERLARIANLVSFRSGMSESDMSDADLREAIDRALRASEPGYLWISAVFPGDGTVVYAAQPGEALQLFRREYSVESDGMVALSEGREEVRPVTVFEPVTAAAGSGCGSPTVDAPAEGGAAVNKQERIKALLENKRLPFRPCDQKYLEGLPDDRLEQIETHASELEEELTKPTEAVPETPPVPAPATAAAAPPPKAKTVEEFLAEAPEEIRTLVSRQKAADAARRTELVSGLKAAQDAYTEEELNTMPLEALEKLSRVAGKATTEHIPPRSPEAEHKGAPAPIDMAARIAARHKGAA
jgi:hypothetical protein